ncbi:MAG: hypothetical protein JSS27_04075 [Planctomycetes bacterium]|nr:hypothetical protein [Planctomycetota bacterium]
MNTSAPLPANDEQRQLDLLADGELSEAERRQLLLRFEHEPGAWRRCALALLEAQEWRWQMGAYARKGEPQPAAETSQPKLTPASRLPQAATASRGNMNTLFAMAASFVVALGLGLLTRDYWLGGSSGSHPTDRMIAQAPLTAPSPVTPSVGEASANLAPVVASAPAAGVPVMNVARDVTVLVNDAAGRAQQMHVPLVEGSPDAWRQWTQGLQQASPLPAELQKLLEQSGHRIDQHRQLMPIRLSDGRIGIVPVDQVEIHPASTKDLQ